MKTPINLPPELLNDPKVKRYLPMLNQLLRAPRKGQGRKQYIKEVAAEHGVHEAWAYRLLKRLNKGESPIKSRTAKRIMGTVVHGPDTRAQEKAISLHLSNTNDHRDQKTLFIEYQAFCEAEGLKSASYRSFCRIRENIPAQFIAQRDSGSRAVKEDFAPSIKRDFSCYHPMEVVGGDQHTHDWVCFDNNFNVTTLENYFCMCLRTDLIFAAIASGNYQQFHVGQAITNALRWGIFSTFYCDLGKQENSAYITALLEQLEGFGIDCQAKPKVNAQGRWPRAKPNETVNGIFDRRFKNKGLPGYRKRLRDPRANEAAQKELRRQIARRELLNQGEMAQEILAAIEEWNRHLFTNRGQDTGSSPLQIYERETEECPVTVFPDDVLDYLFLPEQIATVRRSEVRIKHPYLGPIDYHSPDLLNANGDRVFVRWHPYEAEWVWVFGSAKSGKPGELLAKAEIWESINPKDRQAVLEKMEKQGHLVKLVREHYQTYVPKGKKIIRAVSPYDRKARQLKEAAAEEVQQSLRLVGGSDLDAQKAPAVDTSLLRKFRESLRSGPDGDEKRKEQGSAKVFHFSRGGERLNDGK